MLLAVEGANRELVGRGVSRGSLLPSFDKRQTANDSLYIGLINNMPDAVLEGTELQFLKLLDAASGDLPVQLEFFSLPTIPRGERAQRRVDEMYSKVSSLGSSRLDAVIITGTEPRQPDLRQEPYWNALAAVLDWAEENTTSTVLSCLAAHAGVLHGDGISRYALASKQCGVFEFRHTANHPLTAGAADPLCFPHSRWNETRAGALRSCGYSVLSESPDAGVDLFVKKRKRSLFVHFQGHPEYGALSLFNEYRRDVNRFLKRETGRYPSMPEGYFDPEAGALLEDFRMRALDDPSEELNALFPSAAVVSTIQNTWRPAARSIYGSWLQFLASNKANTRVFAAGSHMETIAPLPAKTEIAEEPAHV